MWCIGQPASNHGSNCPDVFSVTNLHFTAVDLYTTNCLTQHNNVHEVLTCCNREVLLFFGKYTQFASGLTVVLDGDLSVGNHKSLRA